MKNIYVVTMRLSDGAELISRIFNTIKAARKWKKYLSDCLEVRINVEKTAIRIMKGGPGGIETN